MTEPPEDYHGDELLATAHARRYNDWILGLIRPALGRVVVEVGAGQGNFTRELLRAGPERLVAIEPSSILLPLLRDATADEPRVDVRAGTLHPLPGDLREAADSVVYINVLEHIADDDAELATAIEALRPGGHLVVFVPALPWLNARFDRAIGHHRRYRMDELRDRAADAGFEIETLRWFDLLGVATWAIAVKLLHLQMRPGNVGFYDRFAVPVARLLDRLTGPPIGKSLVLIARKPGVG